MASFLRLGEVSSRASGREEVDISDGVPSAEGAGVRKQPQCGKRIPNENIGAWMLTSKVNIDIFEGPVVKMARVVNGEGGRRAIASIINPFFCRSEAEVQSQGGD